MKFYKKKLKKFLLKIHRTFISYKKKQNSPIGLSSLGIKHNCLNEVNRFNYSINRFCSDILSPVPEPFYLKFM